MSASSQGESPKFNVNNLYREENFTDRKVGTIRRLTPVDADGLVDGDRRVVYIGQTQIMTAMGALPLSFEIEAESLEEAATAFHEGATRAYEETMKEMEALRREQASSIVVPGAGAASKLQL